MQVIFSNGCHDEFSLLPLPVSLLVYYDGQLVEEMMLHHLYLFKVLSHTSCTVPGTYFACKKFSDD